MNNIKVKFDIQLLNDCIKKDNAELIGEYNKLSSITIIKFKCNCGEEGCQKSFRRIFENGGAFCKKCTKKNTLEKVKATNLEKFGVEFCGQSKEIQEKIKATNLEKLGVEYPTQSNIVREKTKVTILKKYGVEYISQSDIVKDKMKTTNLERYGVENPSQSIQIKEKVKSTNLKNFGVAYSLQSNEVKQKSKQTNLKKYGVEHCSQNPDIAEKASKNAYKRKEIILKNGNSIFLQGYEPQAYTILLDTYNEDEIITNNKLKPEIWWTDSNNIKHRYFPDFYIPKDNLIIEIKSIRTYNMDDKKEKIQKTTEATKSLGFNFELWILNQKGNILNKY